jgi:L-ascorbate metabolism protein UlaG (beta-lactamase superfamily)
MIRHVLLLICIIVGSAAMAQDRIPSHCRAFAQAPGMEYLQLASFREPVANDTVRISYVDHAMFLIQSETVSAMTDFTGWYGNVEFIPDVVTMNNAHSTHFTSNPDPAIAHVLEGWTLNGQPRNHELDLGEMLIRNVHTDIRARGGDRVQENGNSIFVFEVAGLCIGHLGHLHHELDETHYAMLGRLDVVMAAVDGGLTLRHETLLRVMDRLRSSVVIPMHWFGRSTLDSFLDDMETSGYDVVRAGGPQITLSLNSLPSRRTVMVLEPEFLAE